MYHFHFYKKVNIRFFNPSNKYNVSHPLKKIRTHLFCAHLHYSSKYLVFKDSVKTTIHYLEYGQYYYFSFLLKAIRLNCK